jgi:protein SCO1/2
MKPTLIGSVAAVAALGLAAGAWFALRPVEGLFAGCGDSVVAGEADIGGPFTLVSETGATVTDTDVFTEPSLVYFGFTFCPDVCPLDNARNAAATDILAERGIAVQPVFISVDPERDTPKMVRDFTDLFHPEMLGLTGSPEQVATASRAYRTYYRAEDTDDPFYLVDHSTFTYLVLPEHGFVEFFRRDATAEEVAETTACFVEAA